MNADAEYTRTDHRDIPQARPADTETQPFQTLDFGLRSRGGLGAPLRRPLSFSACLVVVTGSKLLAYIDLRSHGYESLSVGDNSCS